MCCACLWSQQPHYQEKEQDLACMPHTSWWGSPWSHPWLNPLRSESEPPVPWWRHLHAWDVCPWLSALFGLQIDAEFLRNSASAHRWVACPWESIALQWVPGSCRTLWGFPTFSWHRHVSKTCHSSMLRWRHNDEVQATLHQPSFRP